MTGYTGKVLIIDDEAILRSTLSRILESAGCETRAAEDGYDAFTLLEEQTFDLVYLDIQLPEMNGLLVLKEIRQRQPKLPVILLTGYGSVQSAIEALRLGASDYLLKPLDPDVLVARTRMILKEQAIDWRKRELQEQIAALQLELQSLERESLPQAKNTTALSEPYDRFLKRGRLVLDLRAQRATFGEAVLDLPPSAFDYLMVLARQSPEVVAYQALVNQAQKYQVDPGEARELAKWHVHVLRQAIENDPQNPQFILNVRGVGYRLLVD